MKKDKPRKLQLKADQRKRIALVAFAVVFAAVGVITLISSFAASGPLIDASRFPVGFRGTTEVHTRNFGNRYPGAPSAFRIICKYSHMSYDDPIVFPGQDNAAHLHMFFGNRTADENSTPDSLMDPDAETTCHGGALNKSSYWAPALIHNGDTPLEPEAMFVYYKPHNYVFGAAHQRDMQPIPDDLKLIAGDATSKTSQPPEVVYWQCDERDGNDVGVIPQNCRSGQTLKLMVGFPSCWNGRDLDSPNHRDHLKYMGSEHFVRPYSSVGGVRDFCEAHPEHNIQVPQITMNIEWRLPPGVDGSTVRLSSDAPDAIPGASAHADFMEGWDRNAAEIFVRDCIAAGESCTNDLGNDTYLDDYLELVPENQRRGPAQIEVTNPGDGVPQPDPDTNSPLVSVTDPFRDQSFDIGDTINFAAMASDDVGVTNIRLRVNGSQIGSRNDETIFVQRPASDFGVGNHVVEAVARDAAGNVSRSETEFTVTEVSPDPVCEDPAANNTDQPLPCVYDDPDPEPDPDTTPPSVEITSPADRQVVSGDSFAIEANASDDREMRRVEFYLDGQRVRRDSSAPYSHSVDVTGLAVGSHTIMVRAIDTSGNSQDSRVQTFFVEDTSIPGDVNDDGRVSLADFFVIVENFNQTVTSRNQGDLNGDGRVTLADFFILVINFGT